MQTYFARHSPKLDVNDATRLRLWEERWMAIHYPEDREGVIGDYDSESVDPAAYPPHVARYFRLLHELGRRGGYVLAEHYPHENEYLIGRVDPGSPIEILRGKWGLPRDRGSRSPVPDRTEREAVLKGFRLRNARVVSREAIENLWQARPRRGTLHRWRSAADAVARLVEATNGYSTPGVNQWERAHRVWNELADYARANAMLTYKQLGGLVGIHPIALRFPLGIIENHCLDNRLPPLNILVVNESGRPGGGFKAFDGGTFEEGLARAFSFDWIAYGNPFGFAANGTTPEEVTARLIADPPGAADVYRTVRVRGSAQMIFRDALLQIYRGRCAFSGSEIPQGLEAAHLVPWSDSDSQERLDVRNGVLLTSWHHKLFDSHVITLSEDYRIRVDRKLLAATSPFDRAALIELDGQLMMLPFDERVHPSPTLIRRRNELFAERHHPRNTRTRQA